MVVGAFPIAKLGALLLRQLSKPIANYVKERAKSNPFFRKYVCMPPAQFSDSNPTVSITIPVSYGVYNWCEIKTKMWLLNLGKPVNIPPLNEAMAIDLGANLLGEGILFTIAAALLIVEYSRQITKQAAKEKQQEDDMIGLNNTIQELYMQTERQEAQLRELFRHVYDLDSRVVKLPWSPAHKITVDDNVPLDVQLQANRNKAESGFISKAISYVEKDVFREDKKLGIRRTV